MTFLYACPLSVLFGAQHSPSLALATRQSLTVHLVGARRAELRHLAGWEMLACRLPSLKRLKLVFVGDEAECQGMPKRFSYRSRELQAGRKNLQEIAYEFTPPTLYQVYSTLRLLNEVL